MTTLRRVWLPMLNAAIAAFLAGIVAAPVLAALGFGGAANALYQAYHAVCHQWAFRSFFVFGDQVIYDRAQLESLAVDPFGFIGDPGLGWKLAVCERDLAIYVGALAFGLWYASHPVRPLGWRAYLLLVLPMAVDGFGQLAGWRESAWWLRVITGGLFGVASAWLLYPRFKAALEPRPAPRPQQAA